MRFPRRLTASVVVSTMLAAGLAGCTSDDDTAGDVTEVVIGADLASGSAVDTAYARALQLKIEQVNASGTLGDRQLVLRIQDNRSDPTASLRNISTFADDPSVAAIVTGVCGECVVGAVKTINEKKLPTIALAASDEVTNPVAERRYVFKLGPNSEDSNAAMVAELIRHQDQAGRHPVRRRRLRQRRDRRPGRASSPRPVSRSPGSPGSSRPPPRSPRPSARWPTPSRTR